jgi:hypothetical protein
MMVEIISLDMYNGLPWPEEEFMKVTIERHITRLLTRHPITWTLLSMLAQASSVLLLGAGEGSLHLPLGQPRHQQAD